MNNGTYYGNNSNGYSYSPDRSRDVNRFNPSTRANYPANYNTYSRNNGYYDGRGVYHK